MKKNQKHIGFSLVELMVVLVILGTIILMAFNFINSKEKTARISSLAINDYRISEGMTNFLLGNYNTYYQYLSKNPNTTITIPIDVVLQNNGFIDTKLLKGYIAGNPNTYGDLNGDKACAVISYNQNTDLLNGFIYFTLQNKTELDVWNKKEYSDLASLEHAIGGVGGDMGYYFYNPSDLSKNKLTDFRNNWGIYRNIFMSPNTSFTSPDGRQIAGRCGSEIRPRGFVINISKYFTDQNISSNSSFFKTVADNNKSTDQATNNNLILSTSGKLKITNTTKNFLLSFLNKDITLNSFNGVWGDNIGGYASFYENDFNRSITTTGTNRYTSITSPYLQTTNAAVQLSAGIGSGCTAGDLSMTKQGVLHQYSSTVNIDEQVLVLCNNSNQYKVSYPINESSMNTYGNLE